MRCPGQDSRYWKPGAIFEAKCPKCGNEVEFFKDDTTRLCKGCGHRLVNPEMDFGCASYCKYAEQCVGAISPELLAQKEELFKERVAIEMKRHFKKDFGQIGHAARVARYAEAIGKEEGGDLGPVITAAYLHGLGAEKAKEILKKIDASDALVQEVCGLIDRLHNPGSVDTLNFKVVHDGRLMADLEQRNKQAPIPQGELKRILENSFLTDAGRILAKKRLSE
jgi:hypothetical protein